MCLVCAHTFAYVAPQPTLRDLANNKLTGGVEVLGKLTQLTQLCVGAGCVYFFVGIGTKRTFFVHRLIETGRIYLVGAVGCGWRAHTFAHVEQNLHSGP